MVSFSVFMIALVQVLVLLLVAGWAVRRLTASKRAPAPVPVKVKNEDYPRQR